jgi:formate C-acetyltransferase
MNHPSIMNASIRPIADRIPSLREKCRHRKDAILPWDGDPRLIAAGLRETENVSSWTRRRGLLTRFLLENLPLAVDEEEILVGRFAPDRDAWRTEREQAQEYLRAEAPHIFTPGQSGHCQLEWSQLFHLGIDGLAADISSRLEDAEIPAQDVYQSFLDALAGLSRLCENMADVAQNAMLDSGMERATELAEITSICRKIAHQPPHTFREALQLVWLTILGCQFSDRAWLVSPGRLDRLLWPFYQQDLTTGRIDETFALLLLECLYTQLNDNIPDGLAVAVMIGGRDSAGQDTTNPLSYLCLEAVRRTRMIYPTVGICWHPGTPQDLIDLAVDLVTHGYGNPAFFNDVTIQRGLRALGLPADEACQYINSTCVEITPCGSSNVWVASPYFSLCQILLDEINAQAHSPQGAQTYADFVQAYKERLSSAIVLAVEKQNENRRQRALFGGKPLQSVFTNDCLVRGLDIDRGGARYNWVECSFVGLANLADSLFVIQNEVFHQNNLTLTRFADMLAIDFAGWERERQKFLKHYPKYGNNQTDVDLIAAEMVEFIQSECKRHSMEPDGSPYVPGMFCWVMHERLGRACGATPDGRKAGFPFADGCGGAQGRELTGPTAAALSVTSWDSSAWIGGTAFNMKFPASLFTSPEATIGLRELIQTFLQRGGFETQINVVDSAVLKAAQQNPDRYRDLIVRIGGYSDYFTRLSPEMQAEIILRSEHNRL